MVHQQTTYRKLMVYTTSVTNGATAAGFVDTSGYDYAVISVYMTTADAVSNKPATLRILEMDNTLAGNSTQATFYATISGFVSGTDYTIPNAITAATSITQPFATFAVDCKNRKRYIRVEVSPVTTQIISAVADLGRAEQSPAFTSLATVTCVG